MLKLHNKIKNLPILKLVLLSLALVFIVDLFTLPFSQSYIRNFTSDDINRRAQELITISGFIKNILTTGIVSPIIETLIFQTLIIRFVLAWTEI